MKHESKCLICRTKLREFQTRYDWNTRIYHKSCWRNNIQFFAKHKISSSYVTTLEHKKEIIKHYRDELHYPQKVDEQAQMRGNTEIWEYDPFANMWLHKPTHSYYTDVSLSPIYN